MKYMFVSFLIALSLNANAQELFVVTEPASNMPAGSIGVRVAQSLMKEKFESGYNYHLMPEIMWGANKNLMVHTSAFISNRNRTLVTEGGSVYAKYRFFSVDDLQQHFRMAAFGRYSFNNSDIHQDEINTMGHNSGYEAGLVATQLIKKVAINVSGSYEQALNNTIVNKFPTGQSNNATNYTLSFGRLMYPNKYKNFKQTNINLMMEFMGQTLNNNGKSFLDVVPSLQFIINSQARIDVAYV
ncbi:MAG: hypothetical protein LH615_02570, partial [Ferruginibacter sp.]|nr:hypothetical protein [Ferruginibacter sp.]